MPRQVIDSNFLQSSELNDYLAASVSNKIVLMDLQSMEMHKQAALTVARHSTAITSRYPAQVLVLRPTQPIYTWRLNTRAKVTRLISARETRGFATYGRAHQVNEPDHILLSKVASLEAEHRRHWANLVRESAHIPQTFKTYAASLSTDERKAIRTRSPYSPALQRKLLSMARDIAIELFSVVGEPDRHRPNQKVHLKDTLVFRYALCIMLHYTRWLADGQDVAKAPEKIANDVVDLHVAAFGTFFDGVLSKDRNLTAVHLSARRILRLGGAFIG